MRVLFGTLFVTFAQCNALTISVKVIEHCDSSVSLDNGRLGRPAFSFLIQVIQTRTIMSLK